MYDPARDSWKSDEEQNGEENALEHSSSPIPESGKITDEPKSESDQEVGSSKETAEVDSNTDEKEHKSIGIVGSDVAESESTSMPPAKSREVNERDSHDVKKRPLSEDGKNINDKQAVEIKDKTRVSSSTSQIDEAVSKNSNTSPNSEAPPRKIRKPISRMSQADRDAQARDLRERIERNERRAESQHSDGRNQHRETTIVRQHYNQRPDQGVQLRLQSPIIKLRSFNNWVKYVLISKFAHRNCTVLDIGCGKGGDLFKWGRAGCSGFIGIDIAEVSVSQARERYEKARSKRFWADFCVGDAFEEDVEDIVHPEAFPVDIVSSQFCLHYAFENEKRVRKVLSNISRALRRDGIFLGTIPNSDVIIKHIRKLEPHELKWGNSIYNVEFELAPPRDGVFKPVFGHKYTFFLEDAVGNVPEYVVPFEAFRALAEEYNLELIFKKPFLRLFDEELEKNSRTLKTAESMGVIKADGSYGIEGDEREACGFYLAFAFRKIGS